MKYILSISAFLSMLLAAATISAQTEVDQINDVVTQAKIRAHMSFIASDALRGRDTGSEGLEAAAAYVSSHFIAHGVDTMAGYGEYLQWIPFQEVSPSDSATLTIGGQTLTAPQDFLVLNGETQQSTMPGKYIGFGQEADLEGEDVRFQFAVAQVGDGESQAIGSVITESREKRERAIDAGAMGLIEIYHNVQVPWSMITRMAGQKQLSTDAPADKRHLQMPHIWLSAADSVVTSALLEGGTPIQLDMQGLQRSDLPSANVIGLVPGTDPELRDEYIVYSAHYDHVGIGRPDAVGDTIYNGARDNAIGTTAVMLLAEYIAAHPTKRSALFVLFTGEEKGLRGSDWFVEHSPVDLDQIKYCFNIDNGGYNDTSVVSVIGLTRTTAEEKLQAACNAFGLEAIEDPAKEQGLFDRSDNVNFARKGIPAPTFSMGFRSFDQEIFKYYHQPGDEMESMDFDYLEKYVKAFVLSAISIGNADENSFWIEGDKYYDVGRELYGK